MNAPATYYVLGVKSIVNLSVSLFHYEYPNKFSLSFHYVDTTFPIDAQEFRHARGIHVAS